jgi:hypothetical protein
VCGGEMRYRGAGGGDPPAKIASTPSGAALFLSVLAMISSLFAPTCSHFSFLSLTRRPPLAQRPPQLPVRGGEHLEVPVPARHRPFLRQAHRRQGREGEHNRGDELQERVGEILEEEDERYVYRTAARYRPHRSTRLV